MPKAEGLTLAFESADKIRTDLLETLPYKGGEQIIRLNYPEFSAVCPFSGLPDIAEIAIVYRPLDRIIELKSLKYYFISFRNVGIYQEDMTARIYRDLKNTLKPRTLYIKTRYNIRGGIAAVCEMGEQEKEEA
ncbi:MAG: preQ(1) synthase [Candidatus Marinimicrobia bacterium]|nr:preQ(1) synthase [Candidatus Neomarinimicrobiota bacterium]MDD4961585.1 preQ(1) synthase [Candidatus Neomarinimicrobiota bacterium]MDD5710248.1 preQ(1) synthase [Candidatus Neomarinimicrobiota bacterium]MDX9777840.1 preQ(1) synthase [bacterium]